MAGSARPTILGTSAKWVTPAGCHEGMRVVALGKCDPPTRSVSEAHGRLPGSPGAFVDPGVAVRAEA